MLNKLKKINFLRLFKIEKLEKPLLYTVVIGIFFITNLLIANISLRLDLSNGAAYTLSSSTKNIINQLDDIINIKFFVSSDLPTRLLPLKNEVTDLLYEYKKQNKNKINFKILDPKKDQNALNEAKELGIPELQFSQLERDKYAVAAVYFGLVIAYGDKKEILPQVTEIESLEYNLTASIYKLTRKEAVKIGILGREQNFNPQEDELSVLKRVFQQQFTIDYLDVSTQSATKEIDSSYKTLLVFDKGQKEYDNQELNALRNYLKNKGKIIFFIDGVWVEDNLTTASAKNNLFSLLTDFGIKVNQNLVLSTSAELVNFGNSQISFLTPYPFWIKANQFNQKVSYFSNINQLVFPWVSSLNLEKKEGVQTKELVKTSKRSWEQKDTFILDPQNIPQPQTSDLKEFIIAAYGKDKNGAELVVIPSSRFILNRYLGRTADNLELILNITNDFASAGALSGIRQRNVSFYPLPELPDNQKDIFKYVNILLLPCLLAVFGSWRLIKRR